MITNNDEKARRFAADPGTSADSKYAYCTEHLTSHDVNKECPFCNGHTCKKCNGLVPKLAGHEHLCIPLDKPKKT